MSGDACLRECALRRAGLSVGQFAFGEASGKREDSLYLDGWAHSIGFNVWGCLSSFIQKITCQERIICQMRYFVFPAYL